MNANELLLQLKLFTETTIKDILMPLRPNPDNEDPGYRVADVHIAHIPELSAVERKVPYICHNLLVKQYSQKPRELPQSLVFIRSVFVVFDEDEQTGSFMLQNLVDRLSLDLLEKRILDNRFELVLDSNTTLEVLVYQEDTRPYYMGEMLTCWDIPPIRREVDLFGGNERELFGFESREEYEH